MLTTNCAFLENEILDVARLFKRRPDTITHSFRFEREGEIGFFYNDFEIDNRSYTFKDRGQVRDERGKQQG